MGKVFGGMSLLVCVAAAVSHFAMFLSPLRAIRAQLGWCSLLLIVVWPAMMISLAWQTQRLPGSPSAVGPCPWKRGEFRAFVLGCLPKPIRIVLVMLLLYTLMWFVVRAAVVPYGSPVARDGRYFMANHGKRIRDISREEYERFRWYRRCGSSCSTTLFACVPMLFFLAVYPQLRKQAAGAQC